MTRPNGRDMRIVGIGAVIGQAHVIPSEERQWIVNHRIDLRTFNNIYLVIQQDCVFGRMSITWLISRRLRIGPRTNTRAAEVKPDPPHPYMSAGPPLCILPYTANVLLHTHFVHWTFYPSSGRSTFLRLTPSQLSEPSFR